VGCKLHFMAQTDNWQPYGVDWKLPSNNNNKKVIHQSKHLEYSFWEARGVRSHWPSMCNWYLLNARLYINDE